ncbi:hypothetical protein CVT24_005420 [Panaeolus cyanescens]|uniref:G domain-containing protein n=1 Tax=Panaeolus cyanescens TaxID=181874 RepID=A0A409WYN2_9AGAR|nr:hypothetical protein CVT24_005420 [Panaeolus cyanescens]
MGPTGAGKSTFIEALAGPNSKMEKISSGRLEGYTQDITCYEVLNFKRHNDYTMYIIDSPGFADTKISEFEIVSKIQRWIKDNDGDSIDRILYLHPITSTRLPRSQKSVLKTFRALTGQDSSDNITIATTMWDSVFGETGHERARSNFEALRTQVWKDLLDRGAQLAKFHNTQASAMKILDLTSCEGNLEWFQFENQEGERSDVRRKPFGINLYSDLVDRIEGLQSRETTLISELEEIAANEEELRSILESDLQEVHNLLDRFQRDLQALGPPPPHIMAQLPTIATIPGNRKQPKGHGPEVLALSSKPVPGEPGPAASSSQSHSHLISLRSRGLYNIWYSTKKRAKRVFHYTGESK